MQLIPPYFFYHKNIYLKKISYHHARYKIVIKPKNKLVKNGVEETAGMANILHTFFIFVSKIKKEIRKCKKGKRCGDGTKCCG